MRSFTVSKVTIGFVILLTFGYTRTFLYSTPAADTKQSSELTQLYRAIEVARLLQKSSKPNANIAKTKSRANATGLQAIAGQVATSDGTPMSRIKAIVVAFSVNADSTASKGFAYVNPDGSYLLEHLLPGNFYVVAQADSFETQYYHQAATLDLPRVAGSISGMVTNAEGEALPDAAVQAYTLVDSFSLRPQIWLYTNTDSSGHFRLDGPAGNYVVSASAYSSWQSVTRWYPNVSTPDSAKPLVVQKNTELKNIDFKLPIVSGSSVIYGAVKSDAGHALVGAFVEVMPADEATKPSWKIWASAATDSLGQFYIPQLPAGKYLVHAQYWEDVRFGEQWHKLADARERATPVEVKESQKAGPVDFQLKLRPQYGSIYGRVTADAGGKPINRAYIEVSPLKRNYYLGAPIGFWNWNTMTNELGEYRLDLLPEGGYLIAVYADGAFEYFENAVVPEQAKAIKVIGGDSVQVHFGLTPRNEGKGGDFRSRHG